MGKGWAEVNTADTRVGNLKSLNWGMDTMVKELLFRVGAPLHLAGVPSS